MNRMNFSMSNPHHFPDDEIRCATKPSARALFSRSPIAVRIRFIHKNVATYNPARTVPTHANAVGIVFGSGFRMNTKP